MEIAPLNIVYVDLWHPTHSVNGFSAHSDRIRQEWELREGRLLSPSNRGENGKKINFSTR